MGSVIAVEMRTRGAGAAIYDNEQAGQLPAAGAEGIQEAIEGARKDSKPRNVFSAMRLTLGTITEALVNLFKSFFAALFWWL
jgi:hypothetical protein